MSNETAIPYKSFLEPQGSRKGLWDWMTSTDHKRIGLMYMYAILTFFLVGVVLGLTMRVELFKPGETIMGPQTYNGVFTLHGIIMIFMVVIPGLSAIFGTL
jgi:cytochrome c oxidase subunit 1